MRRNHVSDGERGGIGDAQGSGDIDVVQDEGAREAVWRHADIEVAERRRMAGDWLGHEQPRHAEHHPPQPRL
jgi:hypothetical protein